MDTYGRLIAIVIAVILVTFFPLQYLAQNQKSVIDNHVQYETKKFADEIRLKGYISIDMYNNYLDKLAATNQLYDIEMVHSKDTESFDTGYNSTNTYEDTNKIRNTSYKAEKKNSLIIGLAHTKEKPNIGAETLSYIKSNNSENEITSFATHTHTDACYGTCTGLDYNGDGKFDDSDCSTKIWSTYLGQRTDYICRGCNKVVHSIDTGDRGTEIKYYTHDLILLCDKVVTSIVPTNANQTIKKGQSIINTVVATYLDGHTGTINCSYDFNTNQLGTFDVTLVYSGLVDNAKTTGKKTCTVKVTIVSDKSPVSLIVTPSSYSVYNGNEPSYTIKVNYDDNTSKVITDGYSKDGFTYGAGTKTVTFTYTENEKTVSASVIIEVKRNLKTCINGHTYELDDYDNDMGCPVCGTILKSISVSPDEITITIGSPLDIVLTATYMDNHTEIITSGYSSNLNPGKLGKQVVTVSYNGMDTHLNVIVTQSITCPNCGTIYPANEDGTDPGCPVCKSKVISISATPESQVVNIKEEMKVEVTATYQDGHKEIVTDWSSNYNSFKAGKQEVTISYQAKSTTVTVIVQSETETTCPICGYLYNPSEYPNGCPKCSKTIVAIEARLRNGGIQVQYGSEINLYVVLIYKDNHREVTYSDWSVEKYQPYLLGKQTVIVKYKEFYTSLDLEVVNTLIKKVCPNGHVYYLNEDGSDPGCPYCNEDPTKNSAEGYLDNVYTQDILNVLYDKGIYYLDAGDYITITVRQKNESIYVKLQSRLHLSPELELKKYSYGGMVGNGESV